MAKSQLTKVKGLAEFLGSLALSGKTLGDSDGFLTVYPWHRYSKDPQAEISLRYSTTGIKLATVRKILSEALGNLGHKVSNRFADTVLTAYVLMNKTSDPISELQRVLSAMCDAKLSQYLIIPASPVFELDARLPVDAAKRHLLVNFGLGPFNYTPLYGPPFRGSQAKTPPRGRQTIDNRP